MIFAAFLLAAALPLLLNVSLPPSVSMSSQLLALFGWGVVMLLVPAPRMPAGSGRRLAPLIAAVAIVAMGCGFSIVARGGLLVPGIGVLGVLAVTVALIFHGAGVGASGGRAEKAFTAFALALLIAAVLGSLIAVVQIFAPNSVHSVLIAMPTDPGRADGNMGQPNQFADTLIWGLLALVGLWESGALGRVRSPALWAAFVGTGTLILLGVILTGSRTALLSLAIPFGWGLLGRSLARPTRLALLALPVAAALLNAGVSEWAAIHPALHVSLTDHGGDATSFRGLIWSNALALIRQHPWGGVGWGMFNFAWTLTPFAPRSAGYVDNAHDLALQLAVELGLPAALCIMGLLLFSLVLALPRRAGPSRAGGVQTAVAVSMVLVVGIHSLLEYPLWYLYLLLPTAWIWGFALGAARGAAAVDDATTATPPVRAWRPLGLLLVAAAASAWIDYLNIVTLFQPLATSLPLEQRIRQAQASPLFSYHADYVAVTNLPLSPARSPEFERSARILLNGRLMYLWANLLQQEGQTDKARYLAARLREFDLPGPKPWFAPCEDPAVTAKPFQCLSPEHPVSWQDFK